MKKDGQHFYEFEDFRLDAVRGVLFRNGSVVDVTPKPARFLRLLVERKGELVSKEEIFAEVWSDSFVEEANLPHTHLQAFSERALGETAIEN
jgi:DNA-binding winged helix-turn-helix (wHTH) protein